MLSYVHAFSEQWPVVSSSPLLHLVVVPSLSSYPALQAGVHVDPEAKYSVQSPTCPLAGAVVCAVQGSGLQIGTERIPAKHEIVACERIYPARQ